MACIAAILFASSCGTQEDVEIIPGTPATTSVDMPEQTPFNQPSDEADDLWPLWRSNQEVPPRLVELGHLMGLDAVALPQDPEGLENIAVGLLGQSCIVLIQDRGVAEDGTIYTVAKIVPRSKRQFDAGNYNNISGYGIAADFGRLKTEMHGITCQM